MQCAACVIGYETRRHTSTTRGELNNETSFVTKRVVRRKSAHTLPPPQPSLARRSYSPSLAKWECPTASREDNHPGGIPRTLKMHWADNANLDWKPQQVLSQQFSIIMITEKHPSIPPTSCHPSHVRARNTCIRHISLMSALWHYYQPVPPSHPATQTECPSLSTIADCIQNSMAQQHVHRM